jgi:phenylalanyl-tRNA synthetase beta chain
MKVTYNWLKDFVEIKIPARQLAGKLTMAGLEVTAVEEKGGDFVFEIEVTSNRPDCLSVIGIAREVAAITGKKLKLPKIPGHQVTRSPGHQVVSIKIEDKKDCPLYTAKIIKDVKVGPSPDWLKERLELVGCRSVNSVVDITNYVLFERGEPLHAFDLDKLAADTIIVRRAKQNDKITTIDAEQRALGPDILVIADKEKAVAIAGIMGGIGTEVTVGTKNVLLEAAIFNPIVIRRGRQKLGLQTDSTYRFERGVDFETAESASWQAIQLIQEIAGGRCVLAKGAGQPIVLKKKIVNLEVSFVSKILGIAVGALKIKKILNSLGFSVKAKSKNNFSVTIPAHRQDINLEIDLIEEIARIFGYENIPTSLPAVKPRVTAYTARDLVSVIKNMLVGLGFNEVITYGLMDRDLLKGLAQEKETVEILNPLSKEQAILRPALIPGLLRCVAYNLNQKQEYINIFEVANTFSLVNNKPKEEMVLGMALCGMRPWLLEQGRVKDEASFLHLKGILETLFNRLGIKDYSFKPESRPSGIEVYAGKEKIGLFLSIKEEILENLDIKNREVFIAEISLEKLFACADLKKKFIPLALYPSISRDISLIVKEDISAADILSIVQEKAGSLLKEIKIIDYYKGRHIPAGFKGLTLSCLYRADDRTLTDAEVNPLHSLALAVLSEKFCAQIR